MAKLIIYVKILHYEYLDDETLDDFSPTQESTRDKAGWGGRQNNMALLSRESFNRKDLILQYCAVRAWTILFL